MSYGTQCIRCRKNIAEGRSFCVGCARMLDRLQPITESEERNARRRIWRVKRCPAYEAAVRRRAFTDGA